MKRRIRKAEIRFISLVPKGANGLSTLYKGDDSEAPFDLSTIVKGYDGEKGELTAVVYVPEMRDAHGDIASGEVIKEAMYEAAQKGFDIDFRHDNKPIPREKAYVAESFIVQKGDPRFADLKDYRGSKVDPTGGWGIVLKINDPELRALYKSGEWNGVSMGGKALFEIEKNGDDSMTLEELNKALGESNKSLGATLGTVITDGITKALTEAGLIKKADAPKPDAPKAKPFSGPFTKEGILKHALKTQKEALVKSLDFTDAEAVIAATEEIEKIDAQLAEMEKSDDKDGTDPASRQIAALQKQIDAIRKASNQPAKGKKDEDAPANPFLGLQKGEDDDAALASAGSRMAAYMNGTKITK